MRGQTAILGTQSILAPSSSPQWHWRNARNLLGSSPSFSLIHPLVTTASICGVLFMLCYFAVASSVSFPPGFRHCCVYLSLSKNLAKIIEARPWCGKGGKMWGATRTGQRKRVSGVWQQDSSHLARQRLHLVKSDWKGILL